MFKSIDADRQAIADQVYEGSTTNRPVQRMTWNQAINRLFKENMELRRSEQRLADIEREAKNQWREWLPRPTIFVSLQNSLNDLGNLSSDALAASLHAPIAIPNPVSQQVKTYQNALQLVQARDFHELSRRRLTIQLYRSFAEWKSIDAEFQSDSTASGEQLIEAALRKLEYDASQQERRNMVSQQLTAILNLPGVDVLPIANTLPEVDYASRLNKIEPGRNHGLIATRLAAYELQAAILRKRGIKLTRWPLVSFNATTPSVYDTRRQDSPWIDNVDQIFLFGSLSQSFDVTGREAQNLRSAEQNVIFVRESIANRLDSDARQWQRLQQKYQEILTKKRIIESRIKIIRVRKDDQINASEDFENLIKLQRELQNLERAKRNFDLEIWLWDDHAWK